MKTAEHTLADLVSEVARLVPCEWIVRGSDEVWPDGRRYGVSISRPGPDGWSGPRWGGISDAGGIDGSDLAAVRGAVEAWIAQHGPAFMDQAPVAPESRRPRGHDPACERCGGTGSEWVEPGPDTEHLRGAVPCACREVT